MASGCCMAVTIGRSLRGSLVYSGITSSISCLEKLMSSFAAGPITVPRTLPFS